MAERPAFFTYQGKVVSKMYSFDWFTDFSKEEFIQYHKEHIAY